MFLPPGPLQNHLYQHVASSLGISYGFQEQGHTSNGSRRSRISVIVHSEFDAGVNGWIPSLGSLFSRSPPCRPRPLCCCIYTLVRISSIVKPLLPIGWTKVGARGSLLRYYKRGGDIYYQEFTSRDRGDQIYIYNLGNHHTTWISSAKSTLRQITSILARKGLPVSTFRGINPRESLCLYASRCRAGGMGVGRHRRSIRWFLQAVEPLPQRFLCHPRKEYTYTN